MPAFSCCSESYRRSPAASPTVRASEVAAGLQISRGGLFMFATHSAIFIDTKLAPRLDPRYSKGEEFTPSKTASGGSTSQPSGSVPHLNCEANETFCPGN